MIRLVLALSLAAGSLQAAAAQEVASAPGALLRGLDKVTGEATDIELRVGDTVAFGRLTVSLADCRYPVGDPTSNAYADVIVLDPALDAPLFQGWMVASSPALSALDHPRYDIWVLRCDLPEGVLPPEASTDAPPEGDTGGDPAGDGQDPSNSEGEGG